MCSLQRLQLLISVAIFCLLIISSVRSQSPSTTVEEEVYGVKYASDCEGKFKPVR